MKQADLTSSRIGLKTFLRCPHADQPTLLHARVGVSWQPALVATFREWVYSTYTTPPRAVAAAAAAAAEASSPVRKAPGGTEEHRGAQLFTGAVAARDSASAGLRLPLVRDEGPVLPGPPGRQARPDWRIGGRETKAPGSCCLVLPLRQGLGGSRPAYRAYRAGWALRVDSIISKQ